MTFPFEYYYTNPDSPTFLVGATTDNFGLFCSHLNMIADRYDVGIHFEVEGEIEPIDPNLEQFLRWMTFASITDQSALNSMCGSEHIRWENTKRQITAVDSWNKAITYWNKYKEDKEYVYGF